MKFYILIINKVNGDDRVSFSATVTQHIPENLNAIEKATIEKGYTITPKEAEDNQIFPFLFEKIKEEGYWSSWMQNWTSATLYLLYRGEESFNV